MAENWLIRGFPVIHSYALFYGSANDRIETIYIKYSWKDWTTQHIIVVSTMKEDIFCLHYFLFNCAALWRKSAMQFFPGKIKG